MGQLSVKDITKFIISIAIPQLAGMLGGFFTQRSVSTWYATLQKPGFTPPDWVFRPVWIILYFFMGVSLYLVWNQGIRRIDVQRALYIFFLQLALNVFWTFVFFGQQSPSRGLVVITVLFLVVFLTVLTFYSVSSDAALCLVPYIIWVGFALILNLYIVLMNSPGVRPYFPA